MAKLNPLELTPDNAKREFVKLFKSAAARGSYSQHRIWSDWLEAASITVHQMPYHAGDLERDDAFTTLEAKYLEHTRSFDDEHLQLFGKLFGLTIVALQAPCGDFLGSIHMELELENKDAGQFFTPYDVGRMMAAINIGDVGEAVKRGMTTLDEPAVGSGSMVIAVAQHISESGYDHRAWMQVQATDIARDCFNMCYIQLGLLGIQAVVRHGNTLSQQIRESRPTPQLRYFWQWADDTGLTQAVKLHRICQQVLELEQPTTERGGQGHQAGGQARAVESSHALGHVAADGLETDEAVTVEQVAPTGAKRYRRVQADDIDQMSLF